MYRWPTDTYQEIGMIDRRSKSVSYVHFCRHLLVKLAIQKVRLAEDARNSRDSRKISLAYTADSRWRNRAEFANGRQRIVAFLKRKWSRELDYRLIKELWALTQPLAPGKDAPIASGPGESRDL